MPKVKQGRRRANRRRRASPRAFAPMSHPIEQQPPRGVTLKTVSRLTVLFALLCLGAFLAGRPPVAAAARSRRTASSRKQVRAGRVALRNNDAGRVLLGLRR